MGKTGVKFERNEVPSPRSYSYSPSPPREKKIVVQPPPKQQSVRRSLANSSSPEVKDDPMRQTASSCFEIDNTDSVTVKKFKQSLRESVFIKSKQSENKRLENQLKDAQSHA
jgi:hypothetical protein